MGRDLRQEALAYLLDKADKQGYVTFDDIMDCADANSLPIQDFDWLSSAITTRGILVYDEAPTASNRIAQDSEDDDYNDYAQSDYESVYDRIIELDESLRDFVTEVRNIKPPQWKEFSQLKYQVTEGNLHARERMIEMHLRIALRIALQRAEAYDMDIQDAVGEACIGLVTAVDKYDPDTNGAFGSYAAMWILQNISRRQPTQRALMYYPVHKKDPYFSAYPLLKAAGYAGDIESLRNPEVYKLLEEKLSFTNEQTEDVLYATIPFESYEQVCSMFLENDDVFEKHDSEEDDPRLYPQELILEDDTYEKVSEITLKEQLVEVLGTLNERERQVLELRYGLNGGSEKTLEEVGAIFNLTRERIRQIEAKALRKLHHPSRSRKLKDYIDYTPIEKHEDE
jgi:RNA polymerase primary sigma factor